MTLARVNGGAMIVAAVGVFASLGYDHFAGPAAWTVPLFAVSIVMWIVSASIGFTLSRQKWLDRRGAWREDRLS